MAAIVLIMGPPGAGKGTQATHVLEKYALQHVATGDLLREAVANKTELGVAAQKYMDAGELVPDTVIIGMLRELIAQLPNDSGVLLDGFPRTVAQAEALDDMLNELRRAIDVVLDITVPHDVLVARLSGRWICRDCQTPFNMVTNPPKTAGECDRCGGELYQREDDQPSAVVNRLKVYENQTAPVSSYYADQGLRVALNGDAKMDIVQKQIDDAMQRAVQ